MSYYEDDPFEEEDDVDSVELDDTSDADEEERAEISNRALAEGE